MVLGAFNSLRILMTWPSSHCFRLMDLLLFSRKYTRIFFSRSKRMNSIESKDNGETNVCVYGAMGKTTIDIKQ